MSNLQYLDDVVSFVLRHPGHKHYIGCNSSALRHDIVGILSAAGKDVHTPFLAYGIAEQMVRMDKGEIDILVLPAAKVLVGWYTKIPNRALSFVEPLALNEFMQVHYRLRGVNSRLGFSLGDHTGFQDVLVEHIVIPLA